MRRTRARIKKRRGSGYRKPLRRGSRAWAKRYPKQAKKLRMRKRKGRRTGRRSILSHATLARLAVEAARRDANYKKFDAARTAIAMRLGVSPGNAQAHYQALIEHDGMNPEQAREATWGFQP